MFGDTNDQGNVAAFYDKERINSSFQQAASALVCDVIRDKLTDAELLAQLKSMLTSRREALASALAVAGRSPEERAGREQANRYIEGELRKRPPAKKP